MLHYFLNLFSNFFSDISFHPLFIQASWKQALFSNDALITYNQCIFKKNHNTYKLTKQSICNMIQRK